MEIDFLDSVFRVSLGLAQALESPSSTPYNWAELAKSME